MDGLHRDRSGLLRSSSGHWPRSVLSASPAVSTSTPTIGSRRTKNVPGKTADDLARLLIGNSLSGPVGSLARHSNVVDLLQHTNDSKFAANHLLYSHSQIRSLSDLIRFNQRGLSWQLCHLQASTHHPGQPSLVSARALRPFRQPKATRLLNEKKEVKAKDFFYFILSEYMCVCVCVSMFVRFDQYVRACRSSFIRINPDV